MTSASTSIAMLNISVERPIRSLAFDEFVNSPEAFQEQKYLSFLSVCTDIRNLYSIYGNIELEYQWSFHLDKQSHQIPMIQSKNCSVLWQAPYPVS